MQNHKIKAIIFDLGRVLLDFDHLIACRKLAGFTVKKEKEIFDLFFDSGLTNLFEAGKISPEDFFSEVKNALDLKLDYAKFLPIWNEIFFFNDKNLAVYNLAESLKNNYTLALLSNINILHFEYIKKAFPILDAFHKIIASFELGLTKPDPMIYERALKILGVSAEQTFYTDDRPELVDSASRLGIKGFLFKGIEELKNDLSACGINTN